MEGEVKLRDGKSWTKQQAPVHLPHLRGPARHPQLQAEGMSSGVGDTSFLGIRACCQSCQSCPGKETS